MSDNKNTNFNLFGFQRKIKQNIGNEEFKKYNTISDEIHMVGSIITEAGDNIGIQKRDMDRLSEALTNLQHSLEENPLNKSKASSALNTIRDIIVSGTGGAVGVGIVAMINSILEKL